jgi:steroid delta-isomerase-like uncharacterized protein
MDFLAGFIERWEAAWNSHQADRVLELMTEDIVYDDSAWPRTMRGHGDVRGFLEHTWRAFPDLRFELLAGPYLVDDAPKAAFWWRGRATHTGPIDPPGLAPTGKSVDFEGVDFQEYRDGRVCRLSIIFDMMGIARQLGTLPRAGSTGEKVAAALQRLAVGARSRVGR